MPNSSSTLYAQRRLIRKLIAAGSTRTAVASMLGIGLSTLRLRFAADIAAGLETHKARLARATRATDSQAKTAEKLPPGEKTANGRIREQYNAYMREYMARRRAATTIGPRRSKAQTVLLLTPRHEAERAVGQRPLQFESVGRLLLESQIDLGRSG